MTSSKTVDGYLSGLPSEQRAALAKLRSEIRSAAPGAIEGISSGVPAFKYRGKYLVSYGAAERHLSLYVMRGTALERMKGKLAGYDATRTVVRFAPGKPLPASLVRQIVEARRAEIDAEPGRDAKPESGSGAGPVTVLFIHSAGAQGRHQGSSDFVAFLKRGLGAGYAVKYPKMPDPEAPDYGPWRDRIRRELDRVDDGAILVGHSLGGSVLLKLLSEENRDRRFRALFLVATPFWGAEGWDYDAFRLGSGFAKRLANAGRIFLYHTRDDDVVSREHLLRYAKAIPRASVREVDGCGHAFDSRACPELIREIRSLEPDPGPGRGGKGKAVPLIAGTRSSARPSRRPAAEPGPPGGGRRRAARG